MLKILWFIISSKANLQVTGAAFLGITITSLDYWNSVGKLIITSLTIGFLVYKWIREHKKPNKNEQG